MRKTADRNFRQRAFRVICIFLLLLLLVGILLAEARRGADAIGRERAQVQTFTGTDALVGYVFRDEVIASSSNNGPVEYVVADGSMVLAGQELAHVYTGGKGGTLQRDEAAPLYAEIERLEKALEEESIAWQLSFADSYSSLMSAFGEGKLQAGLHVAAELEDTLEKRSVLKTDGEQVRIRLALLRAQVEELTRHEEKQTVSAGMNGYFSKETDGYEALFGASAVADLTPEGLQLLLCSPLPKDDTAVHPIGKLVSAGAFYLAVPIAAEDAALYTEKNDYRMRFVRGGTATMTLDRVTLSESGEALLVFVAERCPAGMDFSRRQPLVIEREQVKGISVPASALFYEGDNAFVYIVKEGVAVKRRVRVLCTEDGCCIVASEGGEGYLAAGENILVTSRSVYEGKEWY